MLMKAPDTAADSGPAVVKAFGLELFVNLEAIQNYIHIELLKVNFSANLPKFFEPLSILARE